MNQNNEDRQLSVFEIDANDDETDVVFFGASVILLMVFVGNDFEVFVLEPKLFLLFAVNHCIVARQHLKLAAMVEFVIAHGEWKQCVPWQGNTTRVVFAAMVLDEYIVGDEDTTAFVSLLFCDYHSLLDRNGYSLKDKNEAKIDKTEHGNGKSVKDRSRRHVHLKWANPHPFNGSGQPTKP
ncbi:hypothetical protein Tco_0773597 [Tanacetum coccineum]|uniref:Transposase n=1 Tax=Tanacetum coccineum TaxID=301880 RepID=A0ABQ4ZNR5_9ASTR